MQCEMCGEEVGSLQKYKIEGVILNVCKKCSSLGEKVIENKNKKKREKEIYEEIIISDAGKKIKEEREKRKMRQVDLAKMLMIKDSYLHHIETEELPLNIKIARKIERLLGINLIKKLKHSKQEEKKEETSGMTIGNLLKDNKNRK
ncbi:MAG: helix-turn-helix domain-containing protein [Candidatus Muiribacteriota bacterium]